MPSASASVCFRRVRRIKFDNRIHTRGKGIFFRVWIQMAEENANTACHLSEPDAMA